jgi:CRISPR/Cas system-associated endoribonuclease Cas2
MQNYIIAYDVFHPKRLYKIKKLAYSYAMGGQKSALEALIQTNHTTTNQKIDTHYYEFVKELRQIMQPNVSQGIYPKIDYYHKTLGINLKGHLYDIHQHQTLTKKEAFSAYEYFYNNRENLHIYK